MNNCKNLKKKQRKYKTFIYCNKLKKEINFNDCKNCKHKEFKEIKSLSNKNQISRINNINRIKNKKQSKIKLKSNKLAKIERNRFSLFTSNLDKCIICGKFPVNKHEIFFGNGKRQLSIEYGLVIPLCTEEHHNQIKQKGIHFDSKLKEEWQIKGQKKFEEVYPNLNFLEIFGKNYK